MVLCNILSRHYLLEDELEDELEDGDELEDEDDGAGVDEGLDGALEVLGRAPPGVPTST